MAWQIAIWCLLLGGKWMWNVRANQTTLASNGTVTITSTTQAVTTTIAAVTKDETTTPTTIETCGINSTCTTVLTNKTISTTIATTTTTPKPTTAKPKLKVFEAKKPKKGCSCNTQRSICDINCCCDVDCSSTDRDAFGYCEKEENRFYDTRYCDYIQHIYINNTDYEWHVNENGLFCVVTSNLPPSYNLQKKQPLKTYDEAFLQKQHKYSWFHKEQVLKQVSTHNFSEEFAYGSPLYIIKDNILSQMEINVNYFTDICNGNKKIFYLEHIKTSCSYLRVSEENHKLNFTTYYHNISVIASPNIFNISKFHDDQSCPRNVCLPINTKLCDENFNVCVNITKLDKKLEIACQFELARNINTCKNVVTKLKYNIYHNGTKGIKSVELLAVLNLVKYEFSNKDYEHYVDVEVNFLWYNQSKSYSNQLSGSPGYIIGKPILIGNLKNLGNHTHPNLSLIRDPLRYEDNFLTVPKNINGVCVHNHLVYTTVEFGYNMITKCRFKSQIEKKKNENATNVCRRMQENILLNWFIDKDVNRSFGLFGNADSKELDDWWPILLKTSVGDLLNTTVGNFSNKNNSVYCLNLVSGIEIDVFHSKVDFEDLINQEKILAITFKFDLMSNKTFKYGDKVTEYSMDLKSRIMFYDITAKKIKKFVDPPTFEIKLPYDFFYPFVRVHQNGALTVSVSLVVFVGVICNFVQYF